MSAYDVSLLSVIGINVILAVSLNMISGFCGQISLGHAAFYGAGAYAAALVMISSGSLPLALFAGIFAGSTLGLFVGFASLRVRGDFLAKLGRLDEARQEFERAAAMTRNARERDLLLERARACPSGPSPAEPA